MASKTSAPHPKKGTYDNSVPYSPGPREAFTAPKQPSDGGLTIGGVDGEQGTYNSQVGP